jgi:hypothetical protein
MHTMTTLLLFAFLWVLIAVVARAAGQVAVELTSRLLHWLPGLLRRGRR